MGGVTTKAHGTHVYSGPVRVGYMAEGATPHAGTARSTPCLRPP
jgi:hypothetical protein